MGIIVIEMHMRDYLVLGWIRERIIAGGGEVRLSHADIAGAEITPNWQCHRLTARRIVNTLKAAGEIEFEPTNNRGGCIYRLPKEKLKAG